MASTFALISYGVCWVGLRHGPALMQVWTMSQPTPAFTLDGHDKGVNSVDYFSGGEHMIECKLGNLCVATRQCCSENLDIRVCQAPPIWLAPSAASQYVDASCVSGYVICTTVQSASPGQHPIKKLGMYVTTGVLHLT